MDKKKQRRKKNRSIFGKTCMPGQPTNTTIPIMKTLKMIIQTQCILLLHKFNGSNGIDKVEAINMKAKSSSGFP